MELYDHQRSQIQEIREAYCKNKHVIMQLPTGGGKTVMAGHIAKLLNERGKNVLVIVHRRELIDQFADTLSDVGLGMEISYIAAGQRFSPWCRFQIASVATLVRRNDLRWTPDFIIIDECHHARAVTWNKVLDRWPDVHRLGLSATPVRLDGKGLYKVFNSIVRGPSMSYLIENGYLADYDYLVPAPEFNMDDAKETKSGEYKMQDCLDKVMDTGQWSVPVESYLKYARGKRALFFGVNCDHSRGIAEEFVSHGIRAEHVDGETNTLVRKRHFEYFRRGDIDVICNVDIATEGVDVPGCEVVILGRPTKSLTVYLQQIGRVLRYQDGKRAMVLDCVNNIHTGQFGLPCVEREWDLEGNIVQKNKPLITCVACFAVMEKAAVLENHGKCLRCGAVLMAPADIDDEEDKDERLAPEPTTDEMIKLDKDKIKSALFDTDKFAVFDVNGEQIKIRKSKSGKWNKKDIWRTVYRWDRRLSHSDLQSRLSELVEHLNYKDGWVRYTMKILRGSRVG